MDIGEIIAIIIIALIISLAVLYIIKCKKSGNKCIGCPYAKECAKKKCDSKNNSHLQK